MCKCQNSQEAIFILLLLAAISLPETVVAQLPANKDTTEYISPHGSVGVGRAVVSFDTKIKLTDKTKDISVFLDPEGNLDLPEIARVNMYYATFRLRKKHYLESAYFAVKRESTFFSEEVNLEDIVIANGFARLSDDTKFYFLNYSYAFFQDNRSSVNGLFGISGLDLKYTLEASGELIIDGQRQFDTYYDEASIFAPLPLLGFDFNFAFTRKWSLRNRLAFVGGRYDDIRAAVTQARMNVNYWFTDHMGGVLGFAFFNARVVVENEKELQEIDYGYSGVFAGLHFGF